MDPLATFTAIRRDDKGPLPFWMTVMGMDELLGFVI
jgi:hypothetical protein